MFCEAILQVFSNFAYLFCLLRKEEEQFANYEGVFSCLMINLLSFWCLLNA